MAAPQSKRIDQLALAAPLASSDQIVVWQNNQTKSATIEQVQDAMDSPCECTLVSRYTTVGTDANTVKKYLQTYTLPARIMNVNGNYLEIHAAGLFAANGNTKLVGIELKQNSTGLQATVPIPSGAYNDDYWMIDLRIQRSGDSDYVKHVYVSVTGNTATPLQTAGVLHYAGSGNGVDWDAGDFQICVTGTNSTASANDITCNTFIIEAHLLDPNS